MYQVKNISGGLLVCTLADNVTTLRINNKAAKFVEDSQMTPHIFNLEKRKLVKLLSLSDDTSTVITLTDTIVVEAEKEDG